MLFNQHLSIKKNNKQLKLIYNVEIVFLLFLLIKLTLVYYLSYLFRLKIMEYLIYKYIIVILLIVVFSIIIFKKLNVSFNKKNNSFIFIYNTINKKIHLKKSLSDIKFIEKVTLNFELKNFKLNNYNKKSFFKIEMIYIHFDNHCLLIHTYFSKEKLKFYLIKPKTTYEFAKLISDFLNVPLIERNQPKYNEKSLLKIKIGELKKK